MIRNMESADLDRIMELEQLCFSDPWTKESFEFELSGNPYSNCIVLEEEGRVIGFAIFWITFETAQLINIAVDPARRHEHLGQTLLEYVIEACMAQACEVLSLDVRVSNTPAKGLYEKKGFVPLHVSKGYYADGEDAIVMGMGI